MCQYKEKTLFFSTTATRATTEQQFKLCFSLIKWLQSLQSHLAIQAIFTGNPGNPGNPAILAIWQYFNKYWQYGNNTGNPAQLCVGCWWQDRRSIDLCQTMPSWHLAITCHHPITAFFFFNIRLVLLVHYYF